MLAGFGGLLLLMLVAGADALLVLRNVRTSDAQVRDRYLRGSTAVDSIRAGIYQSAIVMRDYLLATDPEVARAQIEKWKTIRQRTDAALADFSAAADPAEAVPFRKLDAEVQVYWQLLEFISDVQNPGSKSRRAAYFSSELVRAHRDAGSD